MLHYSLKLVSAELKYSKTSWTCKILKMIEVSWLRLMINAFKTINKLTSLIKTSSNIQLY